MSGRAKSGRAALWLGLGCAVIVAVVVAGVLGSRISDPARRAPPSGSTEVPAGSAPAPDGPRTFTFPSASADTNYDSSHHDYPAADMFTSCGTPVLAVTDGVIEDVSTTDEWDSASDDPATRSGLFVSLVDDRGVRYYTSHLASVAVEPGQSVAGGDQVGTVGDTGNAAGTGCHIHFGLSPACLTGWQNRRGLTYPQPFLDDWRSGGDRDPLETIEAIGCG
ncbi:M23 family metallopeptidase [Candidatus Neomicrothrix sp.]|uniref:M23 family metallopeptidase n=1 Tax=Candidatus Neomicrothrix subdominans TaxID=2954438 RepID=A0A936TH66_9ACTN|nr:M23 family metallopeptidase [Candidatus Microthrix sp.]MBK9298500.1 M23 family metallopeptidase [Candidatus Microthrix subdominans]MBK6312617.1 M23 family metallopeptidase [Candidatus Microthrix sp.]MBK6439633.1 M23 family metallopeptidase [Candidatus Microthrix sp.]MBK6969593.1 M23 family metallopeptidase [Candidatus Microthrix sp.]MBK7164991.1 M23 family metallopeptidase [Candidatus Microthrix sp.]